MGYPEVFLSRVPSLESVGPVVLFRVRVPSEPAGAASFRYCVKSLASVQRLERRAIFGTRAFRIRVGGVGRSDERRENEGDLLPRTTCSIP